MSIRKIAKIWVEEAIKYPDKTKKQGKRKFVVYKRLNGLAIEVVFVKEIHIKVVTVYPIQ